MTATLMRDLLLETYGEYLTRIPTCTEAQCREFFGEGFFVGSDAGLTVHPYVGVYSDTKEEDNPFSSETPDIVWVVEEDGRCIFLYELENY